MDVYGTLPAVGRRRRKIPTWVVVLAVAVTLLVLLALIAGAYVFCILIVVLDWGSSAPAYFVENPQGAYQAWGASDQISAQMGDLGKLSNDNTQGAGPLWFDALRISGLMASLFDSKFLDNGEGTALALSTGNLEVLDGSVYVAGNILTPDFDASALVEEVRHLRQELAEIRQSLSQ